MLRSLHISNFALISTLDVDFCDGLNVLSGETGAGKSIIVDSLTLLLGGRYDKTMLRFGSDTGYVEGVFDIDGVADEMNELGFDGDDCLIVTRKFNADGRSEIRINGRVATASMLRSLTGKIIDLCGQHEYQTLAQVGNHIKVLDYYTRHINGAKLDKLSQKCLKFKDLIDRIDKIGDEEARAKNIAYLTLQINEIEEADVKEGEEDELVTLRRKYLSAETVKESLSATYGLLSENDDFNVLSSLSAAKTALSKIDKFSPVYSELLSRLNDALVEVEDVAESVGDELNSLDFSDDDMDALEKRLEKVRSITRKYGLASNLNEKLNSLKAELDDLTDADALYAKLIAEKEALLHEIYELSSEISKNRRKMAAKLEKDVEKELSDLGMQSRFEVRFSDFPTFENCEESVSAKGMDQVEFYLSANVGQPLNPLVKIISGGELSRLMLALKVVSSSIDETPVLIFDEIDAGISGKIGLEVAKKLARLTENHQVISVTHLPQICAMADANYYISKTTKNNETFTNLELLDVDGVYEEISRLTGAKGISAQSVSAAIDMKKWSDDFKKANLSNRRIQ